MSAFNFKSRCKDCKNNPCIMSCYSDCVTHGYKSFEQKEKETKIMATKMKDTINPDHYKNSCSLECIEAMEMAFGCETVFDFCKCNAWKYIWRWKNKNGEEDLKKAQWYLDYVDKYNFNGENRRQINNMKNYIYHELGISEEPCNE